MTLADAVAYYAEREPRGEYVLVIEGGSADCTDKETVAMTPEQAVAYYLAEGMSRNEAIKAAAKATGRSRSEVYDLMKTE